MYFLTRQGIKKSIWKHISFKCWRVSMLQLPSVLFHFVFVLFIWPQNSKYDDGYLTFVNTVTLVTLLTSHCNYPVTLVFDVTLANLVTPVKMVRTVSGHRSHNGRNGHFSHPGHCITLVPLITPVTTNPTLPLRGCPLIYCMKWQTISLGCALGWIKHLCSLDEGKVATIMSQVCAS